LKVSKNTRVRSDYEIDGRKKMAKFCQGKKRMWKLKTNQQKNIYLFVETAQKLMKKI